MRYLITTKEVHSPALTDQNLGHVCEKCKKKNDLIKHLNSCIEEQKRSIEMLHKMLAKNIA